jgi:hypothetical protein
LNNFNGKLIIIAPYAIDKDTLYILGILKSRVSTGLNVICLKQNILPKALFPALITGTPTQTYQLKELINYSPGHPVLAGINREYIRNLRYGTTTPNIIMFKPQRGNFRTLIGTPDEVLLLEIPYGKGIFIFCQLDVPDPYDNTLLKNMIDYALKYNKIHMPKLAVYAYPKGKIMEILNTTGIPGYRNPLRLEEFDITIICLTKELIRLMDILYKQFFQDIKQFVNTGGKLILFNLSPKTKDIFGDIFPNIKVSFRKLKHEEKVKIEIERNKPIIWGLTEYELSKIDIDEYVIANTSRKNNLQVLVSPGIIAQVNIGHGEIIICQFSIKDMDGIKLLSQILTNLGVNVP